MSDDPNRPTWIRGPELRVRWGSLGKPMPSSTFYDRIERGVIPRPRFPFGEGSPPHWLFAEIEECERQAQGTPAMPPPQTEATAPKRKPGRPRKAVQAAVAPPMPVAPREATTPKRGTTAKRKGVRAGVAA